MTRSEDINAAGMGTQEVLISEHGTDSGNSRPDVVNIGDNVPEQVGFTSEGKEILEPSTAGIPSSEIMNDHHLLGRPSLAADRSPRHNHGQQFSPTPEAGRDPQPLGTTSASQGQVCR